MLLHFCELNNCNFISQFRKISVTKSSPDSAEFNSLKFYGSRSLFIGILPELRQIQYTRRKTVYFPDFVVLVSLVSLHSLNFSVVSRTYDILIILCILGRRRQVACLTPTPPSGQINSYGHLHSESIEDLCLVHPPVCCNRS